MQKKNTKRILKFIVFTILAYLIMFSIGYYKLGVFTKNLREEHAEIKKKVKTYISSIKVGDKIENNHNLLKKNPKGYSAYYYTRIEENSAVSNRSVEYYDILTKDGVITEINLNRGAILHGDRFTSPLIFYPLISIFGLEEEQHHYN